MSEKMEGREPDTLEDGTVVLQDNTIYRVTEATKEVFAELDRLYLDLEDEVIVLPPRVWPEKDKGYRPVVRESRNGYRTQNLVGFLQVKGRRVSIVSRFSKTKDISGDFFFNYMLSKSMVRFSLLDPDVHADSQRNGVSIYAAVFAKLLKDALRKGIMKEYVKKAYNDSNVRGVIDFSRHIKLNNPFVGNIAYIQRDHSADNAMTELIRHTIEFLGTQGEARYWLNQVASEIRQIKEVTPAYRPGSLQHVVDANRKSPVRHAYYNEYRDLQRLCILVLQHQSFIYNKGDSRTYGILFDCATLWEEYLASILSEQFYHPDNRKKTGTQYLFEGVEIYPDFISKLEPRVIADAKYKRFKDDVRGEYEKKDIYQLLSYMFRFNSRKGFLLYPNKDRKRECGFDLLTGLDGFAGSKSEARNDNIALIKLAMGIPSQKGRTFDEFSTEMGEKEKAFRKLFKELEKAETANQAQQIFWKHTTA